MPGSITQGFGGPSFYIQIDIVLLFSGQPGDAVDIGHLLLLGRSGAPSFGSLVALESGPVQVVVHVGVQANASGHGPIELFQLLFLHNGRQCLELGVIVIIPEGNEALLLFGADGAGALQRFQPIEVPGKLIGHIFLHPGSRELVVAGRAGGGHGHEDELIFQPRALLIGESQGVDPVVELQGFLPRIIQLILID